MIEPANNPAHDPSLDGDALAVAVRVEGSSTIVVASGEIDMLTLPGLRNALVSSLDASPQLLVLDLSGVSFLSSGGLALLLEIAGLAGEQSTAFRLVTGSARQVVHPIEVTGIAGQLDVHTDLDTALQAPTT